MTHNPRARARTITSYVVRCLVRCAWAAAVARADRKAGCC